MELVLPQGLKCKEDCFFRDWQMTASNQSFTPWLQYSASIRLSLLHESMLEDLEAQGHFPNDVEAAEQAHAADRRPASNFVEGEAKGTGLIQNCVSAPAADARR